MPESAATKNPPVIVAALYHFARLDDYQAFREPLLQRCLDNGISGTLLLANEGINGTIAGYRGGVDVVLDFIRSHPRLAALAHKESETSETPFLRMKVKLKKEIVTMGVPDTDPEKNRGRYVNPDEWNDLINDPDVLVIDTRNDYETAIGSFRNAVPANTKTFREFPDYVEQNLKDEKNRKIAMFCTGGIRCEKSTAYLRAQGFENVCHLQGGILKYLETVDPEDSLWQGECFVFDERVSVDHRLGPGGYDQCHACRRPISAQDKASSHFCPGVSCPHCVDEYSDEQRARFQERQKQMDLARERGERHIGRSQPSPRPATEDD